MPPIPRPSEISKEHRLGSCDTVSDFAAVYLELYAKSKKRSWKTDQRILDKDVLPYIGSFKLKDLTQASVHAVLDRIDRRGAHNQAWQTLKVVRKMLNYAVSRGAIATNPGSTNRPGSDRLSQKSERSATRNLRAYSARYPSCACSVRPGTSWSCSC